MNTNREIIGNGLYGVVYRYTNDKCLKYITNNSSTNLDAIKEIKDANLLSFYKIYKLLFDKYQEFNGYIMKYYDSRYVDILTMPSSYTLDNFSDMLHDVQILSEKGIYMRDMHSENVIMDNNNITIIDADNYTYLNNDDLLEKNMKALRYLFYDIYMDSVHRHHNMSKQEYNMIRLLFNHKEDESLYKDLKNYKYPIDYIKKKSLEPIKYVMKKGV